MNPTIYDAFSLFISSPTGRGQRGDIHIRNFVRQTVQHLHIEWSQNDIGFTTFDDPDTMGSAAPFWYQKINTPDVMINELLRHDVIATSLVIVHEAGHLAIPNYHLIDQELWCRSLEHLYYNDLIKGKPWRYYDHKKQLRWSSEIRRYASSKMSQMPYEIKQASQGKLVDYILGMSYRSSLTAKWVKDNFNNYGGINNREWTTKGLYIKVLADTLIAFLIVIPT